VWALVVENLLRGVAALLGPIEALTKGLPGTAAGSLAGALGVTPQGQPNGTPGVLEVPGGGTSALVRCLYVAGFVAISLLLTQRRDIAGCACKGPLLTLYAVHGPRTNTLTPTGPNQVTNPITNPRLHAVTNTRGNAEGGPPAGPVVHPLPRSPVTSTGPGNPGPAVRIGCGHGDGGCADRRRGPDRAGARGGARRIRRTAAYRGPLGGPGARVAGPRDPAPHAGGARTAGSH